MATTIVKRAVKGSPLTVTEHDANHQNAADTADAATTAAASANTNANARAPGGTLVVYPGAGRALIAGDNGNVIRCTNVGAVSMGVPAGLPAGFSCVLVQGNTGLVTAVSAGATITPVPAYVTAGVETDLIVSPTGTDAYAILSPQTPGAGSLSGLTDIITYDLGSNNDSVNAIRATANAALAAGGITLATVSGARGTGNTLSATVADGWQGTFQWQRRTGGGGSWTNISGQVASSTVELIGDVANDIRCLFIPTSFFTNILFAPGTSGSPFTAFVEPWNTQGLGQPINPANWTTKRGAPLEFVLGGNGWFDDNGTSAIVIRDAGGCDGTITIPRADNAGSGGMVAANQYPIVAFRGDSAGNVYSYLTVNGVNHHLEYHEWDGAANHNDVVGTTVFPSDSTRFGLRVTLAAASVLVELDSGSGYVTEFSATAIQNLTAQWVGLGYSNGAPGAGFGPIHYAP